MFVNRLVLSATDLKPFSGNMNNTTLSEGSFKTKHYTDSILSDMENSMDTLPGTPLSKCPEVDGELTQVSSYLPQSRLSFCLICDIDGALIAVYYRTDNHPFDDPYVLSDLSLHLFLWCFLFISPPATCSPVMCL